MQQYESEHYIFHYSEGTYIEKNIENIAEEQEKCFRYICSVLQMKPDYKIQYFLFESSREIAKVSNEKFGTDYESLNGFAYLEEIYAVYNENEKCIGFHEDAHLISFVDGYGDSVAVREGLAMFFDREWWGIHNLHWVNYYVKNGFSVSIDQMIRRDCTECNQQMGLIKRRILQLDVAGNIGQDGLGMYKKWICNAS